MIGFPHKEAAIVAQRKTRGYEEGRVAMEDNLSFLQLYATPRNELDYWERHLTDGQINSYVSYAEARYHLFKHLDQKREGK